VQALGKMGVEIVPLGGGFTWLSENIDQDKAHAREGWEIISARILSGEYDLIVLDEFTYVLKYGWLPWEDVRAVLDQRPAGMHIVITGRYALPELVEHADLVTEMTEIKHPFKAGIKAQRGIEF
jgi:cob(I)alamin adenosyltransferase